MLEIDSKNRPDELENTFENIRRLLVTDYEAEKEKFRDYVNNHPYEPEQEDWARVIENAETDVRDRLNDPTLLKNPDLRYASSFTSVDYY